MGLMIACHIVLVRTTRQAALNDIIWLAIDIPVLKNQVGFWRSDDKHADGKTLIPCQGMRVNIRMIYS